jgi:hypothetical protein
MPEPITQARLAVLIDGDNAPPSSAKGLMAEIARYGIASVKRAYGDWTTTSLRGWKDVLLDLSIQPIQQFGYTRGKNATDSALIIDAMDLMHTGRFDGFCLVSSDSDFTRLASRLREQGLVVYGFGERKTPAPFVASCDKFIYTDLLGSDGGEPPERKRDEKSLRDDQRLRRLLSEAVGESDDESGWAPLGLVGSQIAKQSPEFDPRDWGFRKLSDLMRATGLFDLEERTGADGRSRMLHVRPQAQVKRQNRSARKRSGVS